MSTATHVQAGHVIIHPDKIDPPIQHPDSSKMVYFEATFACVVEFEDVSVFNCKFLPLEPGRPVPLQAVVEVGFTRFWPLEKTQGLQMMSLGLTSQPVEYFMKTMSSPGNILVP